MYAQVSRECLCSVSISLVLVPLVCYGAFQGDQASRASPATACRVPCLLDSQVVRCSCIIPNWAQSKGFLSKSNPLKRCSLYRGGWPWCSCYHGVKTVRCSCIILSYPESWLRSSEKGETANLRPSPQKGLRTTHRWETSVRNQVKGPGHSQKRNLGVWRSRAWTPSRVSTKETNRCSCTLFLLLLGACLSVRIRWFKEPYILFDFGRLGKGGDAGSESWRPSAPQSGGGLRWDPVPRVRTAASIMPNLPELSRRACCSCDRPIWGG